MNDESQLLDMLNESDFFADITIKKQAYILRHGRRTNLKAGEKLFCEGDPAQRCYMVLKGRLKLSKLHEQGKEAILRYIDPGEVTAAIAVFRQKSYPVTAEAIGNTEVASWSKENIVELMLEYPPLAVNMLRAAIERIDELQTRYLEFYAERVEQRIAHALLRIMKQTGIKTSDGILIDLRLSRQELAEYTGTTLYTVSRTISHWEKSGWIKSGREQIIITNPHALVAFSEKG